MIKDEICGIFVRAPPRAYCLCFLAILVRLLCSLHFVHVFSPQQNPSELGFCVRLNENVRRGLPSVLRRVASRTAGITDSSADPYPLALTRRAQDKR